MQMVMTTSELSELVIPLILLTSTLHEQNLQSSFWDLNILKLVVENRCYQYHIIQWASLQQ